MPSLIERLLGGDEEAGVDLQEREDLAHDRLQTRVDGRPNVDDAGVTGVAVVNEGPDGEPVTVPIARFSLEAEEVAPGDEAVWELVEAALRALVGPFDDVYVRHYDVQFTFGDDGLFDAGECRRVAVPPEHADRLVTEPGWGVADLREALLSGHDIDDAIAPVAWGECVDYSRRNDAAVVAGAAATAAGASAAGASCAGAGGSC